LAQAIKLPEVLLEISLAEYNSMCEKGEDLHFKKQSKYLSGIKVAPFYALNYSANGIWYIPKGGLKINTRAQALDPLGKPVAGLYCAGTVCSQVVAQHYPGSGTLNGQALTFGRIAGQNAAAEQAVS
jgi:3-oxo-5alpha-steroid 4-dehydrogenase